MSSETSKSGKSDPESLSEIVDDDTPRNEAVEWAAAEIDSGRSPESVAADLEVSGWASHDAESITDTAASRLRRRPSSRQQAAGAYGVGDPNTQRAVSASASGAHGATGGLLSALFRMWKTKDAGKSRKP